MAEDYSDLLKEPAKEEDYSDLLAAETNNWVIPPVKEADTQGFRSSNIPSKVINQEVIDLQQKENVVKQVANFLFQTGTQAVDIPVGMAETVAYGATAVVNKVTEGFGQLLYPVAKELHEQIYKTEFPFTPDEYAQSSKYLPEHPQSITGQTIGKAAGELFTAWDKGAEKLGELTTEATGSPELGFGIEVGLKATPWVAGVAGLAKGGPQVREIETPISGERPKTYTEKVRKETIHRNGYYSYFLY